MNWGLSCRSAGLQFMKPSSRRSLEPPKTANAHCSWQPMWPHFYSHCEVSHKLACLKVRCKMTEEPKMAVNPEVSGIKNKVALSLISEQLVSQFCSYDELPPPA